MSKSSGNDDINIAYLDKLTEAVVNMSAQLEKISPNYGSNGQLEQTLRQLAKQVQSGDMTLKQMLKEGAATQKNIRSVEYGLEDTARYNRTVNMFIKILGEKIEDSKLDDVLIKKITTAFENLDVTAILESEKIGQRGGKGAPLKNVMDNEKLGKVNEDLAKRIGLAFDDTALKLMAFFQEQEEKKQKKTAGFVNDLIEGLEKSKWVGGALRDTFRLVGLLGANWLSQFGQMGRILGGAFYIAMETAGPLLVNMLLKGMGSLFGKLFAGGVGWGLINKLPQNGPLGNAITTFYGGGTGAQKAAAAGRLAIAGVASAGLGAGALWAGGQAAQSFKQGDKVGGSAFGVGTAGLGVAAIAALVAGISAPITLIAAAVGGIAVGVGAIWKNREKIMEHYKKNKDFYDKVLKFVDYTMPVFGLLRHFTMWYLDHFGDHTNAEDSLGNVNSGAQKTANALGIQDREAVRTIAGMGINKAGYATNLAKLSPTQASNALKKYRELYTEEAERAYDWLKPGEFNPDLYYNDAAIRNAKGRATLVPVYRGAREDLSAYNKKLDELGLSHLVVGGSMRTKGRKGVTHVEGSKHDNPMGLVLDYSPSWRTWDEWYEGMKALAPMAKERNFDFYFEGYKDPRMRKEDRIMTKNPEDLLKSEFQKAKWGRHIHSQRSVGLENLARKTDAVQNIEASKARAQQQSIDIVDIAKSLEHEAYKDYLKEKERGLGDEAHREQRALKTLEGLLKNEGYYYNDEKMQWMKKKNMLNSKEGAIIKDPSGNYKFERISAIMGGIEVTGASDGRIV